MSIWSESPPTKSGWYWVKSKSIGKEFTWEVDEQGLGDLWHASELLFGPAIPLPEQCAEIAKGGGE